VTPSKLRERLRDIRSRVKGEPDRPGYSYRIAALCDDIKFLLRQMPQINRLKKELEKIQLLKKELHRENINLNSTKGEYIITYTCPHCNEDIKHRCLDFSHDVPEIPITSMGQTDFYCENCDKNYGTGDIDVIDVNEVFG
jgi:uncharacterized protein with PIN domain